MKKSLTFLLLAALGAPILSADAADGIQKLQQVQQLKTNEANSDAMKGADKQRDLVNKQKELRNQQNTFATQTPRNPALQQQLRMGLSPANELHPHLARFGATLREMNTARNRSPRDPALPALATQARVELTALRTITDRLRTGFVNADQHVTPNGGQQSLDDLRKKLEELTKELESEDKLGNFEIQRLMSAYNQAETLASSVQKKASETESSVIGKI